MLPHNTFAALLLAFFYFWQAPVYAANSGNLRLGGMLGLGQGGAQNEGFVRTEGPLGFVTFVDYSFDSRFTLGAEHQRSLGGSASSIGFTGVTGKWYFWTPQPEWLVDDEHSFKTSILIQKNIVPYLGVSTGFAQASFPKNDKVDKDIMVVGPFVALKVGLEYPVIGRWGTRAELSYGITLAGTGQAEAIFGFFGLYYFL